MMTNVILKDQTKLTTTVIFYTALILKFTIKI